MNRAVMVGMLLVLASCGKSETKTSPTPEGASQSSSSPKTEVAKEITELVLGDLASNAFGNLDVQPACVVVGEPAAALDGAAVVAARVKVSPDCSSSEYLWFYSRAEGAEEWSEDFLGPPPECWDGVPDNLSAAVAKSSGIPTCESGQASEP